MKEISQTMAKAGWPAKGPGKGPSGGGRTNNPPSK